MRLRRFILRNQSGAVAIETAFVLPLFLVLVFGIIELALIFYSSIALERIAIDTTRNVKLEAYDGITAAQIRRNIKKNAFGLINADTNLFVVTQLTNENNSPSDIDGPERCLRDGTRQFEGDYCRVIFPNCDPGFFLEDLNADGNCSGQGNASAGGAGSIVRFAIFYDWQILTPFGYLTTLIGDGVPVHFSDLSQGTPTGVKRMVAGGAIRNEF